MKLIALTLLLCSQLTAGTHSGFVAPEHKTIGDQGYKKWISRFNSEEYQNVLADQGDPDFVSILKNKIMELAMPRGGNSRLSLGDFVYLAGDFYSSDLNAEGLQKDPLGASKQIQAAAAQGKLRRMLAWQDSESKKGMSDDATFVVRNMKSYLYRGEAYKKLAEKNSNHFEQLAVKEYAQVHKVAKKLAFDAGQKCETEMEASASGLQQAFMADGSALHYLSDLYAAGHLRVPRAKLSKTCPNKLKAGGKIDIFGISKTPASGLMTKAMHDEDGSLGVKVTVNGETYTSFGDELYKYPKLNRMRYYAELAVTSSVDEVFQSFLQGCLGTTTDSPLKAQVPKVARGSNPPLFKVEDGKLMGRTSALKTLKRTGEAAKYVQVSNECPEADEESESESCIGCEEFFKKYAKVAQKAAKANKDRIEKEVGGKRGSRGRFRNFLRRGRRLFRNRRGWARRKASSLRRSRRFWR